MAAEKGINAWLEHKKLQKKVMKSIQMRIKDGHAMPITF
jgi:hypothetical protein